VSTACFCTPDSPRKVLQWLRESLCRDYFTATAELPQMHCQHSLLRECPVVFAFLCTSWWLQQIVILKLSHSKKYQCTDQNETWNGRTQHIGSPSCAKFPLVKDVSAAYDCLCYSIRYSAISTVTKRITEFFNFQCSNTWKHSYSVQNIYLQRSYER